MNTEDRRPYKMVQPLSLESANEFLADLIHFKEINESFRIRIEDFDRENRIAVDHKDLYIALVKAASIYATIKNLDDIKYELESLIKKHSNGDWKD